MSKATIFKDVKDPSGCGDQQIEWFNQGSPELYRKLRKAHAAGSNTYSQLKSSLPAMTVSGTIKHRARGYDSEQRGFVPSGYGLIDIDGKDHEGRNITRDEHWITAWANETKEQLEELGFAVSISPSGDGVKAWFAIPWEQRDVHQHSYEQFYSAAWNAVMRLLPRDVHADSCRDLHRLQFQTYDPDCDPADTIEVELEEADFSIGKALLKAYVRWEELPPFSETKRQKLEEVINKLLRRKGIKFKAAYQGDTSGYGDDTSAAIFGILHYLCDALPDPASILQGAMESPLVKLNSKYDGNLSYMRRNIQKMLDGRAIEKATPTGSLFDFFDLSQSGFAELIDQHMRDEIIYVPEVAQWSLFKGNIWSHPSAESTKLVAAHICEKFRRSAVDLGDEGIIKFLGLRKNIMDAMSLAVGKPALVRPLAGLNTQRSKIYIKGKGLLDLDTWEFSTTSEKDFISAETAVTWRPGARLNPLYRKLVEAVFDDPEKLPFFFRYMGSSLYAGNISRKLLFCYGQGGQNGKSTLCNGGVSCLGGYGQNAIPGLLTRPSRAKAGADHSADMARIRQGTRVLYVDEAEAEVVWDEAKIKRLVSEDTIEARGLNQDFREMAITFSMLVSSNAMPPMDKSDPALIKRLLILEFENEFEHDPAIKEFFKSQDFQEAILDDILHGLKDYQARGNQLDAPESCQILLDEFSNDLDPLGKFVEEYLETCEREDASSLLDVMDAANIWLRHSKLKQFESAQMFNRAMGAHKLQRTRTKKARYWVDREAHPIRLNSAWEEFEKNREHPGNWNR